MTDPNIKAELILITCTIMGLVFGTIFGFMLGRFGRPKD